jgi:ribosomal protein L37E
MADMLHDVQHEFWRPPANQPAAEPVLADACRRCGTEFMVGAGFCHLCGTNRHRADAPLTQNWTRYFEHVRTLDFAKIRGWFGLPLPSLCAFLIGIVFLIIALTMGLMSVHDYSDFEAIQLWRIQWLMGTCAAFLAGILLKSRKPEN